MILTRIDHQFLSFCQSPAPRGFFCLAASRHGSLKRSIHWSSDSAQGGTAPGLSIGINSRKTISVLR
jgi:hypothetical protein